LQNGNNSNPLIIDRYSVSTETPLASPPVPIHLAIITETWPPGINGVAHTIHRLVQGLLESGAYHIELIRPEQTGEMPSVTRNALKLEQHLVNGLRLPFYPEVQLGHPQYFTLKRRWSRNRPDLVQIVTEGPLGYSAIKAARKLGIPLISDFHTNFDQYSRHYHYPCLFRLIRAYLRHLHNQTRLTLVPTNSLRAELQQNGYERLGLLTRGIDTQQFHPGHRSPALRHGHGIRDEQLLVLLVSRMAQEKNLDLAFKAFRAIQQQTPEARFLLAGDGPERTRLQKQHPDCHFVGMQTGRALAQYYASADLFLYPSTTETFGNVILEAMASGLPVVTFDYAAAREHIHNTVNGISVPFADPDAFIASALELSLDRERCRAIGSMARHTATGLGWEKVIRQFDTTVRNLLNEVRHETATPTECP